MPKTKKKPAATGKLAGKKVAFVGKFGYGDSGRTELEAAARDEGATVVDGERTAPDLLVEGTGVSGKSPVAVAKIQKKHPGVQVVTPSGFHGLLVPTAEEFLAILSSGPRDWPLWHQLRDRLWRAGTTIDIGGADLRAHNLSNANFQSVTVEGADFRRANLTSAQLGTVKGARFDGADMSHAFFSHAEDCSLKNVDMANAHINPAQYTRCDFTGATLREVFGGYTRAVDCTFKRADLTAAGLEESNFQNCDFTGANFTEAKLHKSDFSGANLTGANCTRTDFRNAKFVNADLRKVRFRDAILSGADFTGATVDGADFTGANLAGAVVAGLDTSKAKGFRHVPARVPGPKMLELAKVAAQSKRLEASVELGLANDEYVALVATLRSYGTHKHPGANHIHYSDNCTSHSYVGAPTFEQGMLNLVDLRSKGQPRLETVAVTAKKCPMKPKELLPLARAAWCEALGLPALTDEEWKTRDDTLATAQEELREAMLAELRGGASGVKKFNARTQKEREKLGKLRNLDFSDATLAGVSLSGQDLQGTRFDGATLSGADFERSKLQGASFANANAHKADFALTRATDAVFEGAKLTNCNLRAASFLRANFRNADLTASDFSHSDLCGADFTGATLTKVEFGSAKFDADTKFPAGFRPPENMTWAGAGPHPEKLKAVKLTAAGSIDFATFVSGLPAKVEAARMQKAAAMLKAERFQLFADVTDAALVGVVKSQTSSDLLYSCRLAADGQFGCGTQNLKPCGGLQGALCKHLLVLVVGLAKAGRLDPATVDNWINASKVHKPVLDKDALSDTFLKYKGAEAGTIDWRPTETIPEDFYAM